MKKHCKLKLLDTDLTEGTFTATAYAYGEPDRHGDIVSPGAFDMSIKAFERKALTLPILWQHDTYNPVGAVTSMESTKDGLMIEGRLSLEVEQAQSAYALLKNNALSLSVGFLFDEDRVSRSGKNRIIHEVDLFEISLVTVPANAGAVIHQVKSFDECKTIRDFEGLAREALGLSRRQAKKLAAVGYPVLTGRDDQQADETSEKEILMALEAANRILKGNHYE